MTSRTPLPPIVTAGWGDIDTTATLIADAFYDLPAAAWLVPEPDQRSSALRGQFKVLIEHALFYGHVDLLDDRSAVAVWFHHLGPTIPPYNYDQRLHAACGNHVNRFRHLDTLFDTHHPAEPHHHLGLLAVAPAAQGTGRGTALLTHHHRYLDQVDIPAYLEASSPRSRDLYSRHGYHPRRVFTLPDNTPFWPMWRHPTTPSTHIPQPPGPRSRRVP
ncbi:GNAT family N-acetyltransferase [Micromonospora sonneratiae]|uniref:GNAT family N-acetyltransferase n=1 Tax=Micromonospora sonneratiae TaxID=1184706 RepID=A0ABW3YJK7_9ACTN